MGGAVGKALCLIDTCFGKRGSWKFQSSNVEAVINYILVNSRYGIRVKKAKVIPSKKIVSQCCHLVMDVLFSKEVKRKKSSKINWKCDKGIWGEKKTFTTEVDERMVMKLGVVYKESF